MYRLLLDSDKFTGVKEKDSDGDNALLIAARRGHESVCRLLLDSDKFTGVNEKNLYLRSLLIVARRG